MGAGASMQDAVPAKEAHLKQLPEVLDEAAYVDEKFAFILDPTVQATRFLKYQTGPFINFDDPLPITKEKLNRALVAAMKHGRTVTLAFKTLDGVKEADVFAPNMFPIEVLNRNKYIQEEVWKTVIKPDLGDGPVSDFILSTEFNLVITSVDNKVPAFVAGVMSILKIHDGKKSDQQGDSSSSGGGGEDPSDVIAGMMGAQEIKRNSLKIVEAAFDGDIEEIKQWLEKGYYLESCDGRKHTALSEAACQGQDATVEFLLDLGADPNALSDSGRSPLWRACFNGHLKVAERLLKAGSNPEYRDKTSNENAYDVCKTEDVRQFIQSWDPKETERLMDKRKREMNAKLESRLKTAAEREEFAKMKIREELVGKAEKGDVQGVKDMLDMIADEAIKTKTKPRVTAEVRNERGQSLLSIAAQYDYVDLALMLLTHWKELDKDRWDLKEGELSVEAKTFRGLPNSRDLKGWTCVCIAVFHESKNVLKLLLTHGGDPNIRSSYNKNAWDLAKDELDAANNIVRSKAEIRSVLIENDTTNSSSTLFGSGKAQIKAGRGDTGDIYDGLDPHGDGTALVMQLEMQKDAAAASESKEKKEKGGGKGGKGKKDKEKDKETGKDKEKKKK